VNPVSRLMASLGLRWIQSLRPRFVTPGILPPSGILALWHEHMLLCLPAFAHRNMRVLISQSRDGEFGALAASRLGYVPVRGSSSRGGAIALRSIARDLTGNGGWVAIVADGPRGPRRVAKPGAEWLSQTTGLPVFHVTAAARSAIRLNSWDRCVVPLPFARVELKLSEPFYPKDVKEVRDALEISH
jgi:lysophospholipid acyltransferase (LPLAT)-like uncharacterized protein